MRRRWKKPAELINNAETFALIGQAWNWVVHKANWWEFLEKADILLHARCWVCRLCLGHPLDMGMLGMHTVSYAPNIRPQECDVLIAIGMRFSDRVTQVCIHLCQTGEDHTFGHRQSEIDKNIKTTVAVIGRLQNVDACYHTSDEKNTHKEWRRIV